MKNKHNSNPIKNVFGHRWWAFIIPIIICAVFAYLSRLNLSIMFFEGALFWLVLILLEFSVLCFVLYENYYSFKIPLIVISTLTVIFIFGNVAGCDMFNGKKAYNQLGDVKQTSFTESILPIDYTQIPVVDEDLALKQAEKKLGEERGLGSIVNVGDFTLQQINDELMFVAPLEHENLFKWLDNGSTPGYITVSATDPDDVELVQEVNGSKIKLRYLNSAHFGDNLLRHIRNSGYAFTGVTDMSFELDDNGRPYWTVTTYENTAFWALPEATGIIICDPQTGECTWFSIEEVPEWVDKIQPADFIDAQIDNYGRYEQGFWNSVFGKNGVIIKTPGVLTVYNDGDCYYYTGMTSVGNDDATTGFMMVNTRTKETTYFELAGATEEAAQASAEGMVQEKEYTATLPVPLNVQGIPTYFMTLKDKAGLIKSYAMVNIENYSIVATGSTVAEVQQNYIDAMVSNGNNVVVGSQEAYLYHTEGIVSRISAQITDGNTTYYMIIGDDNTKLYVASSSVSDELAITREGDNVRVSYIDDSNGTVNISDFDNLGFSQEVSDDQEKKDEQSSKKEELANNSTNNIIEVNPKDNEAEWNSLTDEEKAKLLENNN